MDTFLLSDFCVLGLDIEILTFLLTLLSTFAWLIYVYYTIMTFKEIKKQTDLQSRSYLILNTKEEILGLYRSKVPSKSLILHDKWLEIITNNYPKAMREEQVLILKLMNRGKSDIINWDLKIRGRIKAGNYLKNKLNITDEEFEVQLKSTTNQQIAPNEDIQIPILPIGLFPFIEIEWEILYSDTLTDETYKLDSNGFEFKNLNLIVFEAK